MYVSKINYVFRSRFDYTSGIIFFYKSGINIEHVCSHILLVIFSCVYFEIWIKNGMELIQQIRLSTTLGYSQISKKKQISFVTKRLFVKLRTILRQTINPSKNRGLPVVIFRVYVSQKLTWIFRQKLFFHNVTKC